MMVGKEDLAFGLSLSLGPLHHPAPRRFLNVADATSAGRRPTVDVNRAPAAERESRGEGSSSPSAVSSSGGKRDNETERACSRGPLSDEEDADGSRKKLRLSKDQSVVLEESFKEHSTLNPKQKLALAKQLKLRPRQVEVWFQNRRARTKLKQTEVDCELLKRCCEGLTEENRRLHKEVQELRALKIPSPQHLYAHHNMTPPTTLTMCPSCQRITSSSSSSSSSAPHRLMPQTGAGAGRTTPWAPIPLRPSFSQNS
ncbi:putative homeobox-leucine zipper protein HOX1 [Iris pallida]|uniref:Homeobox-leucine zipper protein HOX1 n=1 Tax=Iris pallida TaxID=29817 RepID=A0AAX6EKW1_IRIPA|nr:putative homeobox-leucine zipper protein HOX1 [Iris pallida]